MKKLFNKNLKEEKIEKVYPERIKVVINDPNDGLVLATFASDLSHPHRNKLKIIKREII